MLDILIVGACKATSKCRNQRYTPIIRSLPKNNGKTKATVTRILSGAESLLCNWRLFLFRFVIKGRLQKSIQDEMNLTRQELMIMALSMALLTVGAFPFRISQKRALDSEVTQQQATMFPCIFGSFLRNILFKLAQLPRSNQEYSILA